MPVRARLRGNQIILEGDERVRAKLDRVNRKLRDLRWLWANLIELFQRKQEEWFASEGRGSWPPLSPTYAAWKARVYPGRPILVATGDLRTSLTTRESVLAQTDQALYLGTTVSYAAFHLGGPKMPARPPIIPRVSLVAGLVRRIQDEIERTF